MLSACNIESDFTRELRESMKNYDTLLKPFTPHKAPIKSDPSIKILGAENPDNDFTREFSKIMKEFQHTLKPLPSNPSKGQQPYG